MDLTELIDNYVIELRNKPNINSEQTINGYISALRKFYNENNRIYRMSVVDIKKYMSDIRRDWSDSYYNVIGSALRILYSDVLNQPNKMNWFKPIRTHKRYVDIMSHSEFIEMGKRCSNSKHKLILVILYSTGVRLGELLDIKISDIDFIEKRIFIRTEKGGKNRHVKLHRITEKYMLKYMRDWNPDTYLLNGQKSIKYSSSSVQSIIKRISNGKYSPHDFRHHFISEIIDKENVFAAQEFGGHLSLSSTLIYNHISKERMKTMYNPMDQFVA